MLNRQNYRVETRGEQWKKEIGMLGKNYVDDVASVKSTFVFAFESYISQVFC